MTDRRRLAAALSLATLYVAALCLPDSWQAAAEYHRAALIRGEWWRLWTGHIVHADAGHALGSVYAMAGLALLSRQPLRLMAALMLVIAPLMSAALLLLPMLLPWPVPILTHYRGASGLLFVWMTYLLCHPRAVDARLSPWWRLAVAAVLTVKLAWDLHAWLGIAPSSSFQVAGEVHLVGALFGVVLGCCVAFTAIPSSVHPVPSA